MNYAPLREEYARLWQTMTVRTSFKPQVEKEASKILANKDRYIAVSDMTRVPWYVIGIIHQMEAGCSFGCHLHNGDPLVKRTVQVPANRPVSGNGPFKWETSACDALLMKKLEAVQDWSIERIAYEFERFNGFGYRNYHRAVLTPYLWSGSIHYARGKYVADGRWDSSHVSRQVGAMTLLQKLIEVDESVRPVLETPAPAPEPNTPEETKPDSFVKADGKASEKGMGVKEAVAKVAVPAAVAVEVAKEAVPALPVPAVPEVVTQSISNVETWKGMGASLWTLKSWALSQPMQAGILLLVVAAIWFGPRLLQKS